MAMTDPARDPDRDRASDFAGIVPSAPPLRPDLPAPRIDAGARAVLRAEDDDFVVDEIPAYGPSGEGEHVWLWIEKRGVGTLQLVERLARHVNVPNRAIGYAGLKDAHAVTRQALTLPPEAQELDDAWLLEQGVRVLERAKTQRKLKLGHLRGNRFAIRLRGTFTPEHAEATRRNLEFLSLHGCPNGFGEQRFGGGGGNLARGLSMLNDEDPRKAVRSTKPSLARLWIGSVQSEVFSRTLAARVARYGAEALETLWAGDVAWLHRNGACFVVDDDETAVRESARCRPREDGARGEHGLLPFELSPSGPMPGPRMLAPTGAPAALEAEVLATLGLTPDRFSGLPMRLTQGVRRPMRVPVGEPSVSLGEGGASLDLAFNLPRGAYATVVVRQLVDGFGWWEPRERAGDVFDRADGAD
jgi:tRNA pseudouridine13 synthase